MQRIQRHGRERGQVATGIILSVVVGLVAVGLLGVVALSRGADERTKSQSAADAAALAGANSLADVIPNLIGLIHSRRDLDDAFGCGLGRAAAEDFASRNGATLTSYCFDARADQVRVSIRMNEKVTDDVGPATAKAVASPELGLDDCDWTDHEPPPPTTPSSTTTTSPSPTSSTPTTPPPAQDYTTTLKCGPLKAVFKVDGETGRMQLSSIDLKTLRPRLKD